MMNKYWKALTWGFVLLSSSVMAQEKPAVWDLKACIDYARIHNIQIRQSRIALEESLENTKQAKANRLPSLSFTSGQNYVNRPRPEAGDKNTYSGSYNLNSSVSLYEGGKLRKNMEQMNLQNEVQGLAIKEAENNIELAITQAFVQVLYADESVKINESTVEVSKAQRDRGKALLEVGSLSKADFAQLESQYASDQYQLVVAQTTLDNARLELKQLLELGVNDQMELEIPQLSDESVLTVLPTKESVYLASLKIMPEVKYNQLNIEVANIEQEKAWSDYLPNLTLSAGMGSSHASGIGTGFATQTKQNWSENIGLTLNIPIFNKRATKTAVNLAKLNVENAQLAYENIQKELLKSIETVYQDAVSAQNRYRSAKETLAASELSFELTQQQFFLGAKNTVEMMTEKNNLWAAQQEVIQAKYMAVLNLQLLNFYQGKAIEIK